MKVSLWALARERGGFVPHGGRDARGPSISCKTSRSVGLAVAPRPLTDVASTRGFVPGWGYRPGGAIDSGVAVHEAPARPGSAGLLGNIVVSYDVSPYGDAKMPSTKTPKLARRCRRTEEATEAYASVAGNVLDERIRPFLSDEEAACFLLGPSPGSCGWLHENRTAPRRARPSPRRDQAWQAPRERGSSRTAPCPRRVRAFSAPRLAPRRVGPGPGRPPGPAYQIRGVRPPGRPRKALSVRNSGQNVVRKARESFARLSAAVRRARESFWSRRRGVRRARESFSSRPGGVRTARESFSSRPSVVRRARESF